MKLPRGLLHSLLALVGSGIGARPSWATSDSSPAGAESLLRAGRFEEARQAFEGRVVREPRDRVALVGLGFLALLRNDLPEAERRLEAALQLKRSDKKALALLAQAYYRRDDFGRAAPLFRKVGRKALAQKLESFGQRVPYRIEGDLPSAQVPFLRTDPLPIVSLRINGTEGRFLIDTGGAELILDREFARKVEALRFGSERDYFGGGRRAGFEHGRIDAVDLGGFAVRDVPVHIMDLHGIGPALDEPRIDGILGTVLLYHFQATIDYAAGYLRLDRRAEGQGHPEPAAQADGGVAVPFWLADDHFMVTQGRVNGAASMLFLVDTGLGGVGFTCPKSTLAAAAIEVKGEAVRGIGAGGRFAVVPFTIGELALGSLLRRDLDGVTNAFPPQLEWDLGFRLGGLISHQFFRPGSLTLDFEAMRLVIR